MDPWLLNSAGVEGDYDPLLDPSPLARQRALAQRVRQNPAITMPSSAVETPQADSGEGYSDADILRRGSASAVPESKTLQMQLAELIRKRPDEAPLIAEAGRRQGNAQRDLQAAMTLQALGGETFKPFGGQVLQRALKGGEDYDIPGGWGTVSREGVVWNPAKQKESDLQHLQFLANLQTNEELRRDALAERARAAQAREDTLREARAFREQQAKQGKFQAVKDQEGNVHLFNTLTGKFEEPGAGEGGAPTGGAPGAAGAPGIKLSEVQSRAFDAANNIGIGLKTVGAMQDAPSGKAIAALTTSHPVGRAALNKLLDANDQAFVNAGGKILAAILRKESGAAITAQEWAQYGPQYLPWYGDDPQTIADKIAALNNVRESYTMQAGPQGARVLRAPAANAPARPAPSSALPRATLPARAHSYLD